MISKKAFWFHKVIQKHILFPKWFDIPPIFGVGLIENKRTMKKKLNLAKFWQKSVFRAQKGTFSKNLVPKLVVSGTLQGTFSKIFGPKLEVSRILQGTFPKIFGTKIKGFRNPTRYFFKNIRYQNQGFPEPYKVLFQKYLVQVSGTLQGTFQKVWYRN